MSYYPSERRGWPSRSCALNIHYLDKWNNDQMEENHKNKKAMITLISSMSREEGGKFQHCILAKKMWETLENHYEGNVQVRSKKVQLHMYEY